MCDFREPPIHVVHINTNKIIDANFQGIYSKEKFENKVGVYYIPASGSFYAYYDGEGWYQSQDSWGPPSKEYWQESGGYPPAFTKYRFVFDEKHNHSLNCSIFKL